MPVAHDARRGLAQHDIDYILRPEAAARAHHGRKQLLRGRGGVLALHPARADVAGPAIFLRVHLAEIGQQPLAAALVPAREVGHGVNLGQSRLAGVAVLHLPRESEQQAHVLAAVKHGAGSGLVVAARPARFLIITFYILGQIAMQHKTHVGLVNAHAKGDGGHDHRAAVLAEGLLGLGPLNISQTGVIGQGRDAVPVQKSHRGLHVLACGAVNDARPLVPGQKIQQLPVQLAFWGDLIKKIRAVERSPDQQRVAQGQPFHNVPPHPPRGRGRERGQGRVRKHLAQPRQFQIIRPKIMSPLRNAVRLVNGEKRQLAPLQQSHELRHAQAFRRNIHQVQIAGQQPRPRPFALGHGTCAVESHGLEPRGRGRIHLVFHQGNQRADHHAHPVHQPRRQLIAQRLAPARGHDGE